MPGPMPRDHGRAGRLERGGRARGHLRPTVRVRLGKDSLVLVSRCGQVRATGGRSARSLACTPNGRPRGRFGSQTGLSAASRSRVRGGGGTPGRSVPSGGSSMMTRHARSIGKPAALAWSMARTIWSLTSAGSLVPRMGPIKPHRLSPQQRVLDRELLERLGGALHLSVLHSAYGRVGNIDVGSVEIIGYDADVGTFGRTSSRAVAVFPQRY
jgi:hypothetical protein